MATLRDFLNNGRSKSSQNYSSRTHSNIEEGLIREGLFQIATQTCNLLVQVNTTNNFYTNSNQPESTTDIDGFKTNIAQNTFDVEQSLVLLPITTETSQVTFTKTNSLEKSNLNSTKSVFSTARHRLSVRNLEKKHIIGITNFKILDKTIR
jgi:hypothetical protein